MITIRIKDTGEIVQVTPNVAHDLIDRGKAVVASQETSQEQPAFYANRSMGASRHGKGRFKTR